MLTQDEIKKADLAKLQAELKEARKKHYLLKIGVRTKHLKNAHEAKAQQKYIAQILTQINALNKVEAPVAKAEAEEKAPAKA